MSRRSIIDDSDDSTEDLIFKDVTPPPNGVLSTEPYLNYVVEIPKTQTIQRHSFNTKFLVVLLLIVIIICVVFMCLYFREKHLKLTHAQTLCVTPACVETAAFIQSSMDSTVDPCDDFYLYACGGWLAKNPIPDGHSRWGIDSALSEKNQIILRNILRDTRVTKDSTNKAELKCFQLFRSCMDMHTIEQLGVEPLRELLTQLGNFSNESKMANVSQKSALMVYIKRMHRHALISPFFSYHITADDMDSKKNIIKLLQSGLGLNEYQYNKNDTVVIQAYISYLVELASMIYDPSEYSKETLKKYANETYYFEKNLKQIYVPSEDRVTVDQTYYPSSFKNLSTLVPHIDWFDFMSYAFDDVNITLRTDEKIVISTYKYFEKLGELLDRTPLRVVLNHGVFHAASMYANYLTENFQEIKKNLSIAETGVFKVFPRWKRCVTTTDAGIGMALGAMFVKKAFASNSHEEANKMVQQLRNSYIKSFDGLHWMDETTKKAAAEKAKAINQKIGYPEFILKPSILNKYYNWLEDLSEKKYFENEKKIGLFEQRKELLKLRQAVDTNEWYMTPPTINAYYDPSTNEIVFPAGILQPPYFKVGYPSAVNYGSMGAVIGHEITHGFDNNGRLYDKDGNYHGSKSWWTQKSLDGFNERKQCFIDQYSHFIEANMTLKGNVTLGENIADNGGLTAAYRAYKDWVKLNGEDGLLPGLSKTNDEIFFISFGQSWCTDELSSRLAKQVETDVHSPAFDRVRGSLENNEDFARVFNCPSNSNMNPSKKCSIW